MIDFLAVSDVLNLHADQVDLYGGDHGVRDIGLLESAVAQPDASPCTWTSPAMGRCARRTGFMHRGCRHHQGCSAPPHLRNAIAHDYDPIRSLSLWLLCNAPCRAIVLHVEPG